MMIGEANHKMSATSGTPSLPTGAIEPMFMAASSIYWGLAVFGMPVLPH